MPFFLRWCLLHLLILPFRPGRTVNKYKQIWTEDGFPLVRHGYQLVDLLATKLGHAYHVQLAMRYGSPSIQSGLASIKRLGTEEILIIPLYPQYASATTGTVMEQVFRIIGKWQFIPQIKYIPYFYNRSEFIECWVAKARVYLSQTPDHVLFSFHGLPVKQIMALENRGDDCLKSDNCCDVLSDEHVTCYRAQCIQTARKIAEGLEIPTGMYSISFQSRLGRTKWLEPYTSVTIQDLALKGVRNLLVMCPSFVADCLETIHEIGIEEEERFLSYGGKQLVLVPSLNSDESWVNAIADFVASPD